ncbi:hypothetical protein AAU61_08125 [Desulfocarbo indianensis]|nr:hypothetical protein AAU61_08125 [Desulfocarbo indianensis]
MKHAALITLLALICFAWAPALAQSDAPWSLQDDHWRNGQNQARPQAIQNLGARWVRFSGGQIPSGAVVGGRAQGQPLYVCRAFHQDGFHAGKVVNRRCNIGWGGQEIALDDYEVLVGPRSQARWVRHGQGYPKGAVLAGRCPAGDLYVCRAYYQDGMHVGKILNRKCRLGWGGREVAVDDYQVLTAYGASWQRARPGEIPAGAVGGGYSNQGEMFVCRANYRDGVHPGKLYAGKCHLGWGGREVAVDNYDVLVVRQGLAWLPKDRAGNRRCVEAGRRGQQSQCVCRANFRDGLHPGKTWQGRCNIGWGGQEFALDSYEVLVSD